MRRSPVALVVAVVMVAAGPARAAHADGHTVVPGENLSSIAARYGVSVDALATANNIDNPNLVVSGTVLSIPGQQSVYVVQPGDSLTALAASFGASLGDLLTQNEINDPNVIYVGQRLVVPGSQLAGRVTAASWTTQEVSYDDVAAEIEYWSERNGIDANLAKGLAWHESGWQQSVISADGAIGVMQLLPSAAEHVANNLIGVELDPYVLDDNVRMGVRYLRQLLEHFDGDEDLAVAAYYQGERAVREIGVYAESELYVENVLANRDRFASGIW